jgi:molybdate transport system substrate-binding protein
MIARLALAVSLLSFMVLAAGCGKDAPQPGPGAGGKPKPPAAAAPLLVYVGGTMRPAMEEIKALYEKETGREIRIDQGDSGELLIKIETTHQGDMYVAHDPFQVGAEKKGFADKRYLLAGLTPVIVVKKGNPKGIKGLEDLTRDDLRVGLTDEKYSTGGHVMPVIFKKAGIAEKMADKETNRKQVFRKRGGGQVANDVAIGVSDAAIAWNAVGFARREDLDSIEIDPKFRPAPGVDAISSATYGQEEIDVIGVWAVTLKYSKQVENARKFAEFASGEKGRAVFAKFGFSPAPASARAGGK